jgi:phosphatidylserine/phosphatidylglycerophosphate/cardiolipin synthase-like enzyme
MNSAVQRRGPGLAVEELESRQLLSVTVAPGRINLKSIEHGNGAFHVRVVSDTTAAADALQSGSPLVLTLTDQNGKSITLGSPEHVKSKDLNNDGIADQTLKFRRQALQGLAAGLVTVQFGAETTPPSTSASTLSTPSTEEGSFTIFSPGGEHHHRSGQGEGAGEQGGNHPHGPGSHGKGHNKHNDS